MCKTDKKAEMSNLKIRMMNKSSRFCFTGTQYEHNYSEMLIIQR